MTHLSHPPQAGFNEAAGIPRGRLALSSPSERRRPGFNEAAGIPRGRLERPKQLANRRLASMRPRVFPAEDTTGDERGASAAGRFNEAAGIPRGRLYFFVNGTTLYAQLQ